MYEGFAYFLCKYFLSRNNFPAQRKDLNVSMCLITRLCVCVLSVSSVKCMCECDCLSACVCVLGICVCELKMRMNEVNHTLLVVSI